MAKVSSNKAVNNALALLREMVVDTLPRSTPEELTEFCAKSTPEDREYFISRISSKYPFLPDSRKQEIIDAIRGA